MKPLSFIWLLFCALPALAQNTYSLRVACVVQTGSNTQMVTCVLGKTATGIPIQQFTFRDAAAGFSGNKFLATKITPTLVEMSGMVAFTGPVVDTKGKVSVKSLGAAATLTLRKTGGRWLVTLTVEDVDGMLLYGFEGEAVAGSLVTVRPPTTAPDVEIGPSAMASRAADTTAPVIVFETPADGATVGPGRVDFRVRVTDAGGVRSVSLVTPQGSSLLTLPTSPQWAVSRAGWFPDADNAPGEYTAVCVAVDRAGNRATKTVRVTLRP